MITQSLGVGLRVRMKEREDLPVALAGVQGEIIRGVSPTVDSRMRLMKFDSPVLVDNGAYVGFWWVLPDMVEVVQ